MKKFFFLITVKMILSKILETKNIVHDNINMLSRKDEIYLYLKTNIEYINYYEFSHAKFTIYSPYREMTESGNLYVTLPKNTDFYLKINETGICSERNSDELQCIKIEERYKITILVKNILKRKININDKVVFYIKLKVLDKYMGYNSHSYYIEIITPQNKIYLKSEKDFQVPFQIDNSCIFQANITTDDCYTPTIYKLKLIVSYFKFHLNGMLLFIFPKIFYGKTTNDILIKLNINEKECTNFNYDLEDGRFLIKDYSKCFTNENYSKEYIFDIKFYNLMSPRTIENFIIDFYLLNKNGYVILFSNDTINTQYSKILNIASLKPSTLEPFVLSNLEFLFKNEVYLLKNDIIKIGGSREFYKIENTKTPSDSLNENITFFYIYRNTSISYETYDISFKLNYINECNNQLNLTLKNILNPHGIKLEYYFIQIYDETGKYLILDSKIDLYFEINETYTFTYLNISMKNKTNMRFQFASDYIESYDVIQFLYDPNYFYINPCKSLGISYMNGTIGCFNYKDNNTVYFPWGLNHYIEYDSSMVMEFLLYNVYFRHTNKNYSQDYYFDFHILDTLLSFKIEGHYILTIEFECYYLCDTCDDNEKTFCKSCSMDYPFLMKDEGICLKQCPEHYIYNNDNICYRCNPMSNCEECNESDVNICTKCPKDFPYFINGSCYSYCPENSFPYNNDCINIKKYSKIIENETKEDNEEIIINNNNNINNNNYKIIQNRINLIPLKIDNEFIIPFDYFGCIIIILGIIIFNHFLFWKKGYDFNFSGYIIFELSVLFKLNLYFIYPLAIMTGEKLIFYSFSIMFTIQFILNSAFIFIHVIILGIKFNIFSLIISLFFDYKLLKIQKNGKLLKKNKLNKPINRIILYCINIIYSIDILLHISSIIIGTYINSIFKQMEYLSNMIQYTIIVSTITLYFFIFDFVFPTKCINKIGKNNNYFNKENNNVKTVQNDLMTVRTSYNPTTERFRQESNIPFRNNFITNSHIHN